MGDAKRIIVKPISRQDADKVIKALHYSGKVVNNSRLHLGVFMDGKCGGALQFGPSLDKRKLIGLVEGTGWNEFIELNRLAFADWLPRNSESRAIAYSMRWIRKTYPHLKWVVSFADATQCGDGAIYRASGFILIGIKRNTQIWEAPQGVRFSRTSLTDGRSKQQQQQQQQQALRLCRVSATKAGNILSTGGASMSSFKEAGFTPLPGFQLRYIYLLDPKLKDRLTVEELPFIAIDRMNARMYLGIKRPSSIESDVSAIHAEEGGASPTDGLHSSAR